MRCALSPDSVTDDKIFSMLPKKNTGGTPHMYHWTTVEQPDSMIVFSANVAGLNQQPKMHYFFSLAKRQNAMIVMFQDVKLKFEDLPF